MAQPISSPEEVPAVLSPHRVVAAGGSVRRRRVFFEMIVSGNSACF
jgi:hypothetical protein